MLALTSESCPCGRPFGLIARMGGRSEDLLRLSDGRGGEVLVPSLTLALRLDAVTEVAQYRLRHSPEGIRVQAVPCAGTDHQALRATLAAAVRTAIETYGAAPPVVKVELVTELERPRGPMGKVAWVAADSY